MPKSPMFSDCEKLEIEKSGRLIETMQKKRNPLGLKPIDLVAIWQKVDLDWLLQHFLLICEEFYVFYEHPVHPFKNKLFKVNKYQCLDFIKKYMKQNEGSGVDITISSLELNNMILCNHDGDIFRILS